MVGCYVSAAETHLKRLEVMQAEALTKCRGALRPTPVPASLVETPYQFDGRNRRGSIVLKVGHIKESSLQ